MPVPKFESEAGMYFTILNFDVSIRTARQAWDHCKLHRRDGAYHLVWGKLSVLIEDWTAEVHAVCAACGSGEVGEVRYGDEGLTVCRECQTVEGGYRYVNLREYDAA